jgi:LysM repeat protein
VLCRPKKGESLWELAKRYRTDEQAICAANGLEQETPLPSGLLLIPRVR